MKFSKMRVRACIGEGEATISQGVTDGEAESFGVYLANEEDTEVRFVESLASRAEAKAFIRGFGSGSLYCAIVAPEAAYTKENTMEYRKLEVRACVADGVQTTSLGIPDAEAQFFSVYIDDEEGHGHIVEDLPTRAEAEAYARGFASGSQWQYNSDAALDAVAIFMTDVGGARRGESSVPGLVEVANFLKEKNLLV